MDYELFTANLLSRSSLVCNKAFSVKEVSNCHHIASSQFGQYFWVIELFSIKSNLFNTDTKGTEQSVQFTEVSVLER